MYRISKQILAIGLPVATVAATGAAIAYWTGGGGNGSGDAKTAATGSTSLSVTQAEAPTNMAPGVTSGPIEVTVTNSAGSTANVYAAKVVVSIASVTKDPANTATDTCDAADYSLTGSEMTTGKADLAPGASTTFTGASLVFNNSATEIQDACKNATVTLNYVAS